MRWNFQGTTARGIRTIGRTNLPPEYFVPEKYNANWRALTVTNADDDDRTVGSIERINGRRTWWIEGSLASGELIED